MGQFILPFCFGRKNVQLEIVKINSELLKIKKIKQSQKAVVQAKFKAIYVKIWQKKRAFNIHLTAHLVAPNSDPDQLYQKALDVLKHNHSITEITLQIESTECNTLEQHKH